MSYFLKHIEQNIWQGKFSNIQENLFFHAISTRQGGVSKAPYDELNLALHVGDDSDDVLTNRRKFIRTLGYTVNDIVTANQVHGVNVAVVNENQRGLNIPETDALITNTPDLPLMLFFADCVPVLFADEENLAVGIAHAGWKGTVKHIAQKTFQAMQENFGTKPENCFIGIAPSIGKCCYEVGKEVLSSCYNKFVIERENKFYLDLQEYNKFQLTELGIPEENIVIPGDCTCCKNSWYFSYRANNPTGRIAACLGVRS